MCDTTWYSLLWNISVSSSALAFAVCVLLLEIAHPDKPTFVQSSQYSKLELLPQSVIV